jgi:uncharacterized YccA/Bax inhibitor family protein
MGIDALFVMPEEMGVSQDQPGTVALIMVWTMVLFGGWIWALLAAVRGRRGGVIAALIFSLLSGLLGGVSLIAFCVPSCAAPPVGNIIVWAELITGLVASIALGVQLRRSHEG